MVPMLRPNASWMRYPPDRGHAMNRMYIDRDAYQIQYLQHWSMYEEAEQYEYERPPNRYVDN